MNPILFLDFCGFLFLLFLLLNIWSTNILSVKSKESIVRGYNSNILPGIYTWNLLALIPKIKPILAENQCSACYFYAPCFWLIFAKSFSYRFSLTKINLLTWDPSGFHLLNHTKIPFSKDTLNFNITITDLQDLTISTTAPLEVFRLKLGKPLEFWKKNFI